MLRTSRSKKPVVRMMKNQLSSLVMHEKIITTLPRAKKLKVEAEILISLLKKENTITLKRRIFNLLYSSASKKALDERLRYKSVSIYKLAERPGDGSKMAQVRINITEEKKKEKNV